MIVTITLIFSTIVFFQTSAGIEGAPVFRPQEATRRTIDVKVYLRVFVDTLGYVSDARIDSSDNDALRQSAGNAVRGIRFRRSYGDAPDSTTWLPLVVRFQTTSDSTTRTKYTVTMERPPGSSLALDKDPGFIKVAVPIYPPEALNQKLEGRVVVETLIDTSGSAQQAYVVETDHVIFNESALEVVGRFHFAPGMRNGQPAPVWVGIPIQFALPKSK